MVGTFSGVIVTGYGPNQNQQFVATALGSVLACMMFSCDVNRPKVGTSDGVVLRPTGGYRAAALARARRLQAARKAFISVRSSAIREATPLYFLVVPLTSRWTAPWWTRP